MSQYLLRIVDRDQNVSLSADYLLSIKLLVLPFSFRYVTLSPNWIADTLRSNWLVRVPVG